MGSETIINQNNQLMVTNFLAQFHNFISLMQKQVFHLKLINLSNIISDNITHTDNALSDIHDFIMNKQSCETIP